MSDTTSSAPVTAADPAVSQVISDAGTIAGDVKDAVAAGKAGGFPAIAALAPRLVPDAEKAFKDVEAAIPAIKSGWKTSEFWLIGLFGLANAIVPLITGKPIPFDVNGALSAVLSVYAVVRAVLKKPAA